MSRSDKMTARERVAFERAWNLEESVWVSAREIKNLRALAESQCYDFADRKKLAKLILDQTKSAPFQPHVFDHNQGSALFKVLCADYDEHVVNEANAARYERMAAVPSGLLFVCQWCGNAAPGRWSADDYSSRIDIYPPRGWTVIQIKHNGQVGQLCVCDVSCHVEQEKRLKAQLEQHQEACCLAEAI